jgi:PAS domain-containing protein
MRTELARCGVAGKPYELQYRFLHPDGREIWVRDRAIPYRDPRPTRIAGWARSTPTCGRAGPTQSTIQYETLLENVPAVVYETDPDDERRTRYMNRMIEDLLGYTKTQAGRFVSPYGIGMPVAVSGIAGNGRWVASPFYKGKGEGEG